MSQVLKVPPSRSPALAGFKSVEAVINERRREALARLEAAPADTPHSVGDAMTYPPLAGLAADIEDVDVDTREEMRGHGP